MKRHLTAALAGGAGAAVCGLAIAILHAMLG